MARRRGSVEKLACNRCGAALDARELAEELRCSHCGHVQQLDADALAALEGYRDAAGKDLDEARAHERSERVLAAQTQQMQRVQAALMVVLGPMVILTVLMVAGSLLHGIGAIDWNALNSVTKTMIVVVSVVFSVAAGAGLGVTVFVLERRWKASRAAHEPSSAAREAPVASVVLCPSCGGPNGLRAGAPTMECHFCRGSFAAKEAALAAGLDAAERARREAALSRYRQERIFVAGHGSQNRAYERLPMSAIFVLMPLVGGPILCLSSTIGILQNLFGADNSWAGLVMTAGVGVLLLTMAAAVGWHLRRKTLERSERELDEARAYGGTPIRGLMATAHWLSRHWAGPYDTKLLHGSGTQYLGAEGEVAGYPWFFELAPDAARPRAQILVAAFFTSPPVAAEASEDARRALEKLARDGATVVLGEAGVRVRISTRDATPERAKAIRDDLVVLAARLGGRPLVNP